MRLKIEVGQRFGMLTVISESERLRLPCGQVNRAFLCRCDCGKKKMIRLVHLRNNRIRSCGCIRGEKHGDTGTSLHGSWRAMKMRCYWNGYNEKQYYQDRGIGVCDEWRKSYLTFKAWALASGWKPGLQIDRIDNALGYYPDNCRWTNTVGQANNHRNTNIVEYRGERIAFALLLRRKRKIKHYTTIRNRIKRGYTVEEAVDTPIRRGNYRRAS